MKDYLVDVPVRINIWTRPECQKKQFEIIRKALPSVLFLISDGGRNDLEWEKIRANRAYIESQIDWNCRVYKLYHEENKGLYQTAQEGYDLIWSKVEYCILLEDDDLPAVSYFGFAAEVFRKYLNDPRIAAISPINLLREYDQPSADYLFSHYGIGWGTGLWKRTYEEFFDRSYGQDAYTLKLVTDAAKKQYSFRKRVFGYAEHEYYEGHIAFTEFWLQFVLYAQNQMLIVPKKSLMGNIGYMEGTHTASLKITARMDRIPMLITAMEMNLPVQHPKYVMPDPYYEKKAFRILGYSRFSQVERTLERRFLYLVHGGSLIKGVKKVVARKKAGNTKYER